MADLLSSFRALFGSTSPDKPKNLASVANVRASNTSRVADSLGPEKLGQILRSAREGDADSYLELAGYMEERDPHYFSLLQTRKLAITGADWIVADLKDKRQGATKDGQTVSKVPADPKANRKREIAEALQREVIDTPAFRFWVADAMDAIGKGYAVSQPVWDTSGAKNGRWQYREFRRVDQRVFRFEKNDMVELLLKDSSAPEGVRKLPPGLIVHYPRIRSDVPIRGGLAMLAAVTFMFKQFTIKDWMSFLETYGTPLKIAKYTAGSTTDEEKASLRRALSNIGHDAAMLIPDSVEIEVVQGRAGTSPYLELAEYFDKQLSKAVLGQTMTSDDGASLAQAKEHTKVKVEYNQADGYNVAATAHDLVFKPWVQLNFGLDAEVPWAYPDIAEEEDIKAWSDATVPWVSAGLKVSAPFVREKLGIPEPEAGEELVEKPEPEPVPGAAPGAPKPKPKTATNATALATVEAADELVEDALDQWRPVLVDYRDTIEAMAAEATSYEDFLARLSKFSAEVDSNPFVRQLAEAATKARLVASSAVGQA